MTKILALAFYCISCLNVVAQEFVKGADIGWITQIENRGMYQLVDMKGQPVEAHDLMKQLDMSAVRIRVWVNPKKDPKDGVAYCGLDAALQEFYMMTQGSFMFFKQYKILGSIFFHRLRDILPLS